MYVATSPYSRCLCNIALKQVFFLSEHSLTDLPSTESVTTKNTLDSKVHGANMGPIWGQQDPGGPHVGPMNFAIWDYLNDSCLVDKIYMQQPPPLLKFKITDNLFQWILIYYWLNQLRAWIHNFTDITFKMLTIHSTQVLINNRRS